jgi:hypothetical protein
LRNSEASPLFNPRDQGQGSQNRGNRPNRAGSVTKTDRYPPPNRTYETEIFG